MPYDRNNPFLADLRTIVRENPKNVIFFTGAGVSKFSGLPLWNELRRKLASDIDLYRDSLAMPRATSVSMKRDALASDDLWSAFKVLQDVLGPHYNDRLRTHLTPKSPSNPVYDRIWRLQVKGVVSLNIDRLPLDAYSRNRTTAVDFATGDESSAIARHLQDLTDFVFLPHGVVTKPTSWVFDRNRRDQLLTSAAYKNTMAALMMSRHIVFVGLNPTDVSIEKHVIDILAPLGDHTVRHFIIADNASISRSRYLADRGFRFIPYEPASVAEHREIVEILDDLLIYLPQDPAPSPVSPDTTVDGGTVTDLNLVVEDIEKQRTALTSLVHKAVRQNRRSEDSQVDAIKEICERFPRSMQSAWLVRPGTEQYSKLFGRRIIKPIDDGAFGRVYLAETEDGTVQAVKVLLQEVNNDPRYLTSFLRGVASMRILNAQGVKGMVQVYDAFEIPTCVFMEYIDGLTLEQFVQQRRVSALVEGLDVIIRIGEIVQSGHDLEQRVLHRDLKPANVMLRKVDGQFSYRDIVVLDFDLSWHRGSSDKSVFHGRRAEGYAAPEQTLEALPPGVSTRHVAVDVFGLGMLAFFVFVGRHPRPGEQNFSDFQRTLKEALERFSGTVWRSVPSFLANLIVRSTDDQQASRPGFGDLVSALRRCRNLLAGDMGSLADPLILEEIAGGVSGEIVERDMFGRSIKVQSGNRTLRLLTDDSIEGATLKVSIDRVVAGYDRRGSRKNFESRVHRAVKHLRDAGAADARSVTEVDRTVIEGTIGPRFKGVRRSDITKLAGTIQSALSELQLE